MVEFRSSHFCLRSRGLFGKPYRTGTGAGLLKSCGRFGGMYRSATEAGTVHQKSLTGIVGNPPFREPLPVLAFLLLALAQQHIHRAGAAVLGLGAVESLHDVEFT